MACPDESLGRTPARRPQQILTGDRPGPPSAQGVGYTYLRQIDAVIERGSARDYGIKRCAETASRTACGAPSKWRYCPSNSAACFSASRSGILKSLVVDDQLLILQAPQHAVGVNL